MAEKILTVIILIPLYATLIWTYFYPEDSFLFGKRWMFRDGPEFSEEAIRYAKFEAILIMAGLTVFLISILFDIYFLIYLSIVIFPIIFILGLTKIFK